MMKCELLVVMSLAAPQPSLILTKSATGEKNTTNQFGSCQGLTPLISQALKAQ